MSGISVNVSPGDVSISIVGLLGDEDPARLEEEEELGRRLGVVLGERERLIDAFEGEALALRAWILALIEDTPESAALTGEGDRETAGDFSGVEGGEGSLMIGDGRAEGSFSSLVSAELATS